MPRLRHRAKFAVLALAAFLAVALLPMAQAQYIGKVDTSKSSGPTLRATAVLEFTGDLEKPTASRLVPIAVWDGQSYQPGGLYLAQPVPLTVQTGTQYVLEQAGTPKGLFDVKAAADVGGSWMAIGSYQKQPPPEYAKLRPSRHLPVIVDDSKPHFAHVPAGDKKLGTSNAKPQSSAPPIDPNRPRLERRPSDQSAQKGNPQPSNPAPPIDPNRPILREPSSTPAAAGSQPGSGAAPEKSSGAIDPNRPHLEYGRPEKQESLGAPSKVIASLAGAAPDLKQMAAVSDAVSQPPHSYDYSWPDPQAEKQMESKLETIAQQLLAASEPKPFGPAAEATKTHAHRRMKSGTPAKPALTTLANEQFKAYELSYGAGATLVFSATEGQGDAARYITLIAQPDFNGTPVVLFKQIASQRDLSIVPRMKLVDAVDTDGDNRAELIFELENQTGRQYAIYRVANGAAEQVFATGS